MFGDYSQAARVPNFQTKDGLTALMIVVMKGHFDVVQELIRAKADSHLKDFNNGWMAIHYAAKNGRLQIFKALIEAGTIENTLGGWKNPSHNFSRKS